MNWGQGDDFKSSQDISMTMCENDFVITRVQGTELSIMEIQTLSMISINPAPQKFTSQTALHIACTCTEYGKRKHHSFAPKTWLRFFAI